MPTEELIKLEELNAVEVFSGEKLDDVLSKIEAEVMGFVPDTTTAKGRGEIASLSRKVSKSKVALDNLGKDLVSDWKQKAKLVDNSRKKSRDFLDGLRDKVRQPLTDWEEEQERIKQEKLRKAEEARIAEQQRIEKEQREREEALAKREEEIRKAEEAIKIQKEAEEAERARVAETERLKKEAEENAQKVAADEIEAAKRRELEQTIKAEQAEKDRIEAIRRAEIEKEQAVQNEKDKAAQEATRVESARLAEAARLRQEADARAADVEHRKAINNKAVGCFVSAINCDRSQGEDLVRVIASGKIEKITINY